MSKITSKLFTVLVIGTLSVPFAGMAFWRSDASTENKPLAKWPALADASGFNKNILPQAGAYFEDHFAFRPAFISAASRLEMDLFGESPLQEVIAGKDGWLFFWATMNDYQGKEPLSDRQIANIAHNLGLLRYGAGQAGAKFLFMLVPNKNSVYPKYMKDRYLAADMHNIDRLNPLLVEENVESVDLFAPFQAADQPIYFQKDTHWNNQGALLAYDILMDQMGIAHDDYSDVSPEQRDDHLSDLDEILNPLTAVPETEYHYEPYLSFDYVNEVKDNMDAWIETTNPEGQGSLFMFRDSFGEALLPFFASHFRHLYFSRLTPYNMVQMKTLKPEWIVVERAERELSSLQKQAAIMDMPVLASLSYTDVLDEGLEPITYRSDGGYLLFAQKGLPLASRDEIYLEAKWADGQSYIWPVFYCDDGFEIFLPASLFEQGEITLNTLIRSEDGAIKVHTQSFDRAAIEPDVSADKHSSD